MKGQLVNFKDGAAGMSVGSLIGLEMYLKKPVFVIDPKAARDNKVILDKSKK